MIAEQRQTAAKVGDLRAVLDALEAALAVSYPDAGNPLSTLVAERIS